MADTIGLNNQDCAEEHVKDVSIMRICIGDDPDFAGFEAEALFVRSKRLSEIKTMFIRKCAELDVNLTRNEVKLKSGQTNGC